MKNEVLKLVVALSSLLIIGEACAQKKPAVDSFSVAGGKWVVCADTIVVVNYHCTKPYTGFEFFKNGRYKEYPRVPADPNKEVLEGNWTLADNEFTLDQDDDEATKEFPKTYNIVWINSNRFYANSKVGIAGPKMIVYFQRMP